MLSESGTIGRRRCHTASDLFDVIKDQVHELIVAFERAGDCRECSVSIYITNQFKRKSIPKLTLSAAVEFDGHGLIHVLVKIKDILLLALATVLAAGSASTTAATASVSTATTASSTTAATASKVAAF